jgi:hypothetical protein
MYKYLIRGDSEGCVLIWNIPEVTNSQLAQIKQEDFAKPPGESALCVTFFWLLAEIFFINSVTISFSARTLLHGFS